MAPVPEDVIQHFTPSFQRTGLFPNLNYAGLFHGLSNLLNVFPLISGSQAAIGDAVLDMMKALYFFLPRDCIEQIPYLLASQLGVFPNELDKKLLHLLCDCFIPYVLETSEYITIPAVLMLVFQHSTDPSLHTMLIECLMSKKEDVYKDLILVLAKGTSEARITAANLLFHYWPLKISQTLQKKFIQYRIQAWTKPTCQSLSCVDKEVSSRRCYDPFICAKYGETAPPISLCKACAELAEKEKTIRTMVICNPMSVGSENVCQNRGCQSDNKFAVGICFSENCIRSHQHVPLRLCEECYVALHEGEASNHVRHSSPKIAWGSVIQRDIVEAIVKLLKETSLNLVEDITENEGKRPKWIRQLEGGHSIGKEIDKMTDERRMLSRFGIWLTVKLCPPIPEAHPPSIGYIMSMLFQWFSTTALLPNDSMGAALEQLKTDFLSDWLNLAVVNHHDVFVQTLIPSPPEFAQVFFFVGGVWDKFSTRKEQIKDGLLKLLAILPYDIINAREWNEIIPQWLQSICEEVPEDEIFDLKIMLCKIFEPDLCPLAFETEQLYQFIIQRLKEGEQDEIVKALDWLHLLCQMEISISLPLLLDAFTSSADRLANVKISVNSDEDFDEETIAPQVPMFDIIAQQIELNGLTNLEDTKYKKQILTTCAALLQIPFIRGEHQCKNPEMDEFLDCSACQQSAFVYQTLSQLMQKLCPKNQMAIVSANETEVLDKPDDSGVSIQDYDVFEDAPTTQIEDPGLECVEILPVEEVYNYLALFLNLRLYLNIYMFISLNKSIKDFVQIEMATAEAVTLTEKDVGRVTCHAVSTSLIDSGKPQESVKPTNPEFWDTSIGRFRFKISDLPPELRLINALLNNIDAEPDPDVQLFMLSTLKYLCLHSEVLSKARREHRGFLIWAQENLLIPKLWTLLRLDRSHLSELTVPLVMHCITLPCGDEIFWKTVNNQFTTTQWQERFKAVERMCVLCQLANPKTIRANKIIQMSLSCGIAHLIASVHDPNAAIAQRALLLFRAMPLSVLKLMCLCLEAQFDAVIPDRSLIICRIQLLTAILPNEEILTWDFFIQRFESLALESQLRVQTDNSTFVHDLMHTDPLSALYQRKITKAKAAIEQTSTARSIIRTLQRGSLKHQLVFNNKRPPVLQEQKRNSEAAISARMKLRKVIIMVRVVQAWKRLSNRLPTLSSIVTRLSSRSSSRVSIREENVETVAKPSGLLSTGGYSNIREFTDEESNMCLLLNRVVDVENPERHIVYVTITLFVDFLCRQKTTGDEKATAKKQSVLLRHFNTLIGYSNTEKCFTIPPKRLRKSAVCNAFLCGLPEILDSKLVIANQLITMSLQLLLHLPSPQILASDQPEKEFDLSPLNTSVRHLWLNSTILILYKYRYDNPPCSDLVLRLIAIIICTLECQLKVHKCDSMGQPAKIELKFWSDSSDEENIDPKDDKNGELTIVVPTIVTPIDESAEATLEVITEDGGLTHSRRNVTRRSRHKRRINKVTDQTVDRSALRCGYCNEKIDNLDEETISLCLIALETFLHREPAMASPQLFRIIHTVTRIIEQPLYPWHDTSVFVPGNCRSVAKQLIRVVLHQMSSSGICLRLFDTNIEDAENFWSTISYALNDFPELNSVAIVQILLEDLLEQWPQRLSRILYNLSIYLSYVSSEVYTANWSAVTVSLDTFFRRLLAQVRHQSSIYCLIICSFFLFQMQSDGSNREVIKTELKSCIHIMTATMHVQPFSTFKVSSVSIQFWHLHPSTDKCVHSVYYLQNSLALVESFSKWLTESMHECKADLIDLVAVCTACNRALIRERDKQTLTKAVVFELVQALKFKCEMHEHNYTSILEMILQDQGENISEDIPDDKFNTSASEAIRPHLFDLIDFIADLHVLAKLKKITSSDNVGGDIKTGLAEVVAVEMSRSNLKDPRTVIRFIPWLMSPPSVTQSTPSAFAESVTNVRVLSWLLLGALHATQPCLPVPIECSQHMADYIHFVLAGFADQSKQSVVHMSALFHAFHLCQLWTVYCEQTAIASEELAPKALSNILGFWVRVTPAMLQLLSHSKVVAEMVNSHFLTMMQALQQCNSAVLSQLSAMWQPILTAHYSQIPSHLRLKLDSCESQPSLQSQSLSVWLKKIRYKIAQVELQTSAASPFYNV
uniref:Protein unc-79 homolog n=1 Tax=Syphacia muris TaxID=451379 RepID=A0A158R5X9_9BILA